MDIKRILVPSDLDELSAKVTAFAVELAEQMNISDIVLLNIIIPAHTQAIPAIGDVSTADNYMVTRLNFRLIENHQKIAEEVAKKFATDKVAIKPYVLFNDNKTDLNKYMKKYDADLIVYGNRDEHSFLQVVWGADSGIIVRKIDYPLIIFRDESDTDEIHNILVAIDIIGEDQSGLCKITSVAKALNARMQLLHVLTEDSQSSDVAIKELRELAIKNRLVKYDINVVNNDNVEDGIRSFARKHNSDMIAVLSHGNGKIHNLIYGSSTEDIIRESDKPVLVCKIN